MHRHHGSAANRLSVMAQTRPMNALKARRTGEQQRFRLRNQRIRTLRRYGMTLAAIGALFNLSAPRISQIIDGRIR
jgi:hypothetical protein